MKTNPLPSQAELRGLFTYDPLTGLLYWRVRPSFKSRRQAGEEAGTLHHSGYVQVGLAGTIYMAHRLIWKLMRGDDPIEVDHHNGVRSDNRWLNLREATRSQQGMNKPTPNYHRGVHFMARNGKFGAQIKVDCEHRWLGSFDTPDAACAAFRRAAAGLHGAFYRPGPCGCA